MYVNGRGAANVREEYALTAPFDHATFEVLEQPCSSVQRVIVDDRAAPKSVDRVSRAPWLLLRADGSGTSAGKAVYRLRYDVRLSGRTVSVPIAVPAATLERADDSRGAHVTVTVEFDADARDARVLMPRLHRVTGTKWQGRFLAMPSTIRADLAANPTRACDGDVTGTTGGLEWRFTVFVLVMAVWVPAYLWWFGRHTR